MKQLLKITFLILISLPTYLYAEWSCLIKDGPAQVLLDYKEVNNIIMQNVTKAIAADPVENRTSKLKDRAAETVTIFNQMFNFIWFYSYFDYYVTSPIFNEIPIPIKRDYKYLKDSSKPILSYLKRMDRWTKTQVIVENPCEWIDASILTSCENRLNGMKSKEIIWELLNNNQRIIDLFQLTVVWRFNEFNTRRLILVDNNFTLEIYKHYSKEAVKECSAEEEWGFYERVTESIEEIKIYNKEWENWIQMWKDAWQLLIWNKPTQEDAIEKRELKKYLDEQWISTDNQAIMVSNLEKYNQEWISLNNNFLSNTFISTQAKIYNELKEWREEVIWDFFTKKHEGTEKEFVNYKEVIDSGNNSIVTKRLQDEIINIYEKEIPFATVWDIDTEVLRAKIIETHFSLDYGIRTLEKAEILSQKICEKQDRWEWKCK